MLLHVLLIAAAVHTVEANPRLRPPPGADMSAPTQACADVGDPADHMNCERNVWSYMHRAEEWKKFGNKPQMTMPSR
jgi:hypothetical protein